MAPVTDRTDWTAAWRRRWLSVLALLGFAAVGAGAFGAHGLQGSLEPRMMEVYQTAVSYQMYHSLALLGTLALTGIYPANAWLIWSVRLFFLGIVLFSGSLYALVFSGVTQLGMITPLGGLAFLGGWFCLLVVPWRRP